MHASGKNPVLSLKHPSEVQDIWHCCFMSFCPLSYCNYTTNTIFFFINSGLPTAGYKRPFWICHIQKSSLYLSLLPMTSFCIGGLYSFSVQPLFLTKCLALHTFCYKEIGTDDLRGLWLYDLFSTCQVVWLLKFVPPKFNSLALKFQS